MNVYNAIAERLRQNPKTWLLSGAAGFIGSNLVEALLRLEQRIVGLDNFSTGKWENLDEVRELVGPRCWKNFRLIEGDIRSAELCERASRNVDFILHQAALGSVTRSLTDPLSSHASNVTGFLNMLCAAHHNGVTRFVYASSSSVYGDAPELPKQEEHLGNCLSPYAATKRINELYAAVFNRCYEVPLIGLRYFNVFGPRQDPNGPYAAVIPRWIASLIRGDPIYIYGDGSTSRDFCYVANVVQANLLAANVMAPAALGQVYNVAVCARTSLNQLFRLLVEKLRPWYRHVDDCHPQYLDFRPGDVRHSEADISKAARLLAYQPSHSIEAGLTECLEWYRQHLPQLVRGTRPDQALAQSAGTVAAAAAQ